MERRLIAILMTVTLAWTPASAFNPTFEAKDEEFWNGMAFVIVGRVVQIQRLAGDDPNRFEAEIETRACIGGLLNPAAKPQLKIDFGAGYLHPLRVAPQAGDIVLAVVIDRDALGAERPGFGLANGRCRFMPEEQPLIVLKGMDDPIVLDVLKKLQAARPAVRAPTTRPATRD